jgi:hypothetical protein
MALNLFLQWPLNETWFLEGVNAKIVMLIIQKYTFHALSPME